ncbi:MAG TPA: phenylalanine--tRNA ligase subunit beta [Patescibacteria group bacterium]|nr:phenylalanine--tRNA ligase subunit beta [Patescibacteria group bacterium]
MNVPLNWLKEVVVLPKDTKDLTDKLTMVGHMLDKKIEVDGQTVIDLELRGNRADCYSILGIAREVAAIYGNKIKPLKTSKLIKVNKLEGISLNINTPLVKRAIITKILNVKIVPSPKWLSQKLELYGMESVNNIVDLTNYVMIETGEPMHAFDLDLIGNNLEIRLAKKGEKITTFKNDVLALTKDDLVWTKGDYVLSVAGAIGEKHNSISDSTKNILLEAATYDRANIRKSVYRHNLLTEAGLRHEKDLDPNMVSGAIERFLYLVQKYGWGDCDGLVYDYYPTKITTWKLTFNLMQLAEVGGVEIPKARVLKILKDLSFKIISHTKDSISVEVPTYRTDVRIDEDLIEEVLRIYGYENIPAHVLSLEIPNQITPLYIMQEFNLKSSATAVGFNEAITLSFVKENSSECNVHPQKGDAEVVSLINPPSPDNKNLRTTLLPNLYELSQKAIYERETDIRLFEVGKIYCKYKGKYVEERKIGFTFFHYEQNSFADFKSLIDSFFVKLGIPKPEFKPDALLLPISDSFEILLDKVTIGFGGKIKNIYFIEIDLDNILGKEEKYQVKLWPKYPPQIEDITLAFPEKTKIGEVVAFIISIDANISEVEYVGEFKGNYTFHIKYQNPEKTLTDSEVEKIRNKILKEIGEKFGGNLKN